MICCLSTHIDRASFTFGSSSSLCWGLYGFEFQVMFVISPPGRCRSPPCPVFLTAFTAVNGTWSTAEICPDWRSAIIESALV